MKARTDALILDALTRIEELLLGGGAGGREDPGPVAGVGKLERVFPADQCDWEYVAQREGRLNMPEPWATYVARAQVAAAADRRPIDDEGEVA